MTTTKDAAAMALEIEALLPLALQALFSSPEEDPFKNLPMTQLRVMRTLFAGAKTASELGRDTGLSPSALTQLAGRLISAGLVEKELDPTDRRVRWLKLSPSGQALMRERQKVRAQSAQLILEQMPPERLQELFRLLEQIVNLQKAPSTSRKGVEL